MAEAESGSTTVKITAKEFAFSPKTIKARVGEPITVVLHNEGQAEHDWVVTGLEAENIEVSSGSTSHKHGAHNHEPDTPVAQGQRGHDHASDDHGGEKTHDHRSEAPALHVAAAPGGEGTITFTPTKAGAYQFICSVPGHKELGMGGRIIVQH